MCTKAVCVMEISVFWDMTPSNRAQIYDRFRGTCRLCLQCINVFFVEFIPFLYTVCRSDIRAAVNQNKCYYFRQYVLHVSIVSTILKHLHA